MMKKYLFGICIGIIIAGIVALVGMGTKVAILSGVLCSGVITWLTTIPWEKVKNTKVLLLNLLNLAGETIYGIWQAVKKITLTIVCYPVVIYHKITKWIFCVFTTLLSFCRKVIQGICNIPAIVWQFALTFWNNKNGRSSVLIGYIFTISPYIMFFLIFILQKSPSIFMAFTAVVWMGIIGTNAAYAIKGDRDGSGDVWAGGLYDWSVNLKNDHNRGPVMANLYLAKIRGWNALKIVVYPFLFIFWCFVVLPNNKTRMSTVSAITISGIYLGTAYHFGGISVGNPVFWLSLGIALIVGAWIGSVVSKTKEKSSYSSPPIPTIEFRKYILR